MFREEVDSGFGRIDGSKKVDLHVIQLRRPKLPRLLVYLIFKQIVPGACTRISVYNVDALERIVGCLE